jgi:hypothetical protein
MCARVLLIASVAFMLAVASLAGTVVTAAGSATPDVRLLATYEPVMQFDPLEQFLPTKVESFITDADLEQLTATRNLDCGGAERGAGRPARAGYWHLAPERGRLHAGRAARGLACYAVAGNQGGGEPTVYGRVAREDGEIILQYWYFYYDDVYSYAYPPRDFIWQAHEGDWESVSVVLSGDEQPLYVGYSQHCLGQPRAWADTTRFDDTHPIVHVAIGSHANFFTAGTHPISVACIPAQAVAILRALGLPLPVD